MQYKLVTQAGQGSSQPGPFSGGTIHKQTNTGMLRQTQSQVHQRQASDE